MQHYNYPPNFEIPDSADLTLEEYLVTNPVGYGRDRFPLTPGYLDPTKEYGASSSIRAEIGSTVVGQELEVAA